MAENVIALEHSTAAARGVTESEHVTGGGIYRQAKALVDNVLSLDDDLGRALIVAFSLGTI
jgi:methylaspartate mutase epsilon subunit